MNLAGAAAATEAPVYTVTAFFSLNRQFLETETTKYFTAVRETCLCVNGPSGFGFLVLLSTGGGESLPSP